MVPELARDAAELDRRGAFAADAMRRFAETGLTTMLVPSELGGGGASHAEMAGVLSVLAHGCPSSALTLSMHSHLVAAQVWRHHHDLPAPLLRRVIDEGLVLVSTGAADWVPSHGRAVAVDGGYRVTARKSPSSGAPAGDLLVTSARWEDAPDGPQVLHFAVPFGAAGVSIEETWDSMGMRATGSHTVVLDEVFVPAASVSLTRPAGEWHPVWSTVIGAAMPLITAVYVGVAEAAADQAVGMVAKGHRAASAAALVGRMGNRLATAQDTTGAMVAMSRDLRFDATLEHTAGVLSRKTNAAEACIDTVRLALDAVGGASYSRATGLERLYRDVHGVLHHPLPASAQEDFCGRLAVGLDPLHAA